MCLCPARDKQCAGCGKIGHFIQMCRMYQQRAAPINELNVEQPYSDDITATTYMDNIDDPDLFVGTVTNTNNEDDDLWYSTETVGLIAIKFKLDTGSQANLIPRTFFDQIKGLTLTKPTCGLMTYTGQRILPGGETQLRIRHHILKFQVTTSGSPILGKEACVQLMLVN